MDAGAFSTFSIYLTYGNSDYMLPGNNRSPAAFFWWTLIVALIIFGVMAAEVLLHNEAFFDRWVFRLLRVPRDNWLVGTSFVISFFGSSNFLFPAYVVVLLLLLVRRQRPMAIDVAAMGAGSMLLLYALKAAFGRPRPGDPLLASLTNFGFPSGHALSSVIFFGLIGWLIWHRNAGKTFKIAAIGCLLLFAILVAFSRVLLRYHYASDVIAGFSLGIALLSGLVLLRQPGSRGSATTHG